MIRRFLLVSVVLIGIASCVNVIPPVEDADASFNYGKALMNEGKIALAIIEFKKAKDFFDQAGYTYSAFSVYPYIARSYYLSGNSADAVTTYFEALEYAKNNPDIVGGNELADVMRELAGLLIDEKRINEARYLLMNAADIYKKTENIDKFNETMLQLNEL